MLLKSDPWLPNSSGLLQLVSTRQNYRIRVHSGQSLLRTEFMRLVSTPNRNHSKQDNLSVFTPIHDSLQVEPHNSWNNGIHIRLVIDESLKVWRIELQLLEGADARLSNRKRSYWAYRECYHTNRNQARGIELDGSNNPCDNQMHMPKFVYYTEQSCAMTRKFWETLLSTYEKKATATKIYLIRHVYNL